MGAGPDLGPLWIWHRVLALRGRALPGYGGKVRRFLYRTHAAARRLAERLGRTVAAATIRKLGRGDCRQRPAAARRAEQKPGAGGEVQRVCPDHPGHAPYTRFPRGLYTGL